MATIPDSIKTRLDADWTGAGGAEPTYYVHEDWRSTPPLGKDAVWILSYTLDTDARPVNDTFVDEHHTIELIVNTSTDEDRLKELADEVVRILNATAITGATYQRMKSRKNISDKKTFNYQESITYDIREHMKSSASAYGAASVTTFNVDELTVNTHITGLGLTITQFLDEDNMASDSAAAFASQQSIKKYVDDVILSDLDTTLTGAYLEDLLMFGSANAAWVPCIFLLDNNGKLGSTYGEISNQTGGGGAVTYCAFELPLPPLKGSLKLYISGIKFGIADADAGDYLSNYTIYGFTHDTRTNLRNITTDYTTPQEVEDTFGAVDCSAHDTIKVAVQIFSTNANDFDLNFLTMRCYYAT